MPDAAPEMIATLSASLIAVSSLCLECCFGRPGIPRVWIADLLLHGDNVPAGRKRSDRPGQDDNVHVRIVVHVVPDAGHGGVHGPGERVEGLGRVQGYREHLVLPRYQRAANWE
jgi:hypothetical protein